MRWWQLIGVVGFVAAARVPIAAGPAEELWRRSPQQFLGLAAQDATEAPSPAAQGRPLTPTHRILLAGSQRLSGEWLTLDRHQLQLRTAWADRVSIPRAAIAGIENPFPGAVVRESFERDLAAWKLTGSLRQAEQAHVSGRRSLVLDAAGQVAARQLDEPVGSGRLELWFFLPDKMRGLRWAVALDFGQGESCKVAWGQSKAHYSVETNLAGETVPPLPWTPGWHRLSCRFRREYLLAGIDDIVIWSSATTGPAKPLSRIRLLCEAESSSLAPQGAVYFDDLIVTRTLELVPRGKRPEKQDEVWLESGDQLFGDLAELTSDGIQFQTRLGRQTFQWQHLRGVYLRQTVRPPRPDRDAVRLGLVAANGETDELLGSVLGENDRQLQFRHPDLGDLTVDRGAVRFVRRVVP